MIPIFINVFNRVTTTRNLVAQLSRLKDVEPIIIDNCSTWQPLLDWYDECPIEVIRLRENMGHHAPWKCGAISQHDSEFYIVTDCDLSLIDCPLDLVDRLLAPFAWGGVDAGVIKSGLGLRIDDLPPWQARVASWEARWWRNPCRTPGYYWAAVDTTFAAYRADTPIQVATTVVNIKSTRTDAPYLARHVPWYFDNENLDDENKNYFATANGSNSWKPKGKGLGANYAGG